MRKTMAAALLASIALAGSGCIAVATPAVGTIYTDVHWGGQVTEAEESSKVGTSEATSILSLFATGDASVEAAKKNGGITKVSHVDYHTTNFLGIYGKIVTTVHGE